LTFDIKVFQHHEAEQIDRSQWIALADESVNINPFFEYWALLPALKNLAIDGEVFVVTVWKKKKLIALFPVTVKKTYLNVRFLSVWQHTECYLSDPLCSEPGILIGVVRQLIEDMGLLVARINQHTAASFGNRLDCNSVSFTSCRGAVLQPGRIEGYLGKLPRKVRLENKRITSRLFRITGATYQTSTKNPRHSWLHDYCSLEQAGWKGRVKGAIFSDQKRRNYYSEMYEMARPLRKIEFQGLFNKKESLAISFRMVSLNCAFELKTSYNEEFRQFYPGVVLELINLHNLADSGYEFVDSCTNANNSLVNRLWPDRRTMVDSLYFHSKLSGRILRSVYRFKNRKWLPD
jgi:hypothetical protein